MTLTDVISGGMAQLANHGHSFPIHLTPPTGQEIVAAAELFSGDRAMPYFERAIAVWTDDPSHENPRAAASRFMRRYTGSLVAAAVVPLAHGAAFDLSIDRVSLLIRDELPMGTVLDTCGAPGWVDEDHPSAWALPGAATVTAAALREHAFATLFTGHLGPVIDHVVGLVPMIPPVLWSHVAEHIDGIYQESLEVADESFRAAIERDRRTLLFDDTLPGVLGANPLRGLLEWEMFDDPLFPRPSQVRTVCCLNFLVPGRATYCRTCNRISQDERHELWRTFRSSSS